MFKKILVPIDMQHRSTATRLLKQADDMADLFGAEIHVTTVIPGFGMPIVAAHFPADAQKNAKEEMEANLRSFVSSNMRNKATTGVAVGKRAESILKVANRRQPDLMVIGCNKSGGLGSCSSKLTTHSPCSVLALRLN